MRKLALSPPILGLYAILIITIAAVFLWPEPSVEEENPIYDALEDLMSTAQALNQTSNTLNNLLLKSRVGNTNHKDLDNINEEIRAHSGDFSDLLRSDELKQFPTIAKNSEGITSKVNEKFNLSKQFASHNQKLHTAIKRARELGDRVAEIIVASAKIEAIAKLDLTYQLTNALNNWANFNQSKDADFILANTKKLKALQKHLDEKDYNSVKDFISSLESAVREQKKTDQLLTKAIKVKPISIISLERSIKRMQMRSEAPEEKQFSMAGLVIILAIALITNVLHTLLLLQHKRVISDERTFLRTKTANLLRRARANVYSISHRVQDTVDGIKHHQKQAELSDKIIKLWREKQQGNCCDETIEQMVAEYTQHSKQRSNQAFTQAFVDCTNELDEFESELRRSRHEKFAQPPSILQRIASMLPSRKRIAKPSSADDSDDPNDKGLLTI